MADATFQYRAAGIRSVGSYQVSGIPYVTGSSGQLPTGTEARIQFPFVTKSITVINSGSAAHSELRIHFNSSSAGDVTSAMAHHFVTLGDTGDSVTFNTKCREIYITSNGAAGFELFAELTSIHTGSMFDITGSGLTQIGPNSY